METVVMLVGGTRPWLWGLKIVAVAVMAVAYPQALAMAQGVNSAGIRGSLRSADGLLLDAGRVRVVHEPTGYAFEASVRRGHFLLQGLEPGGPYTVAIQRLGFSPQRREGILLSLGELLSLEFILQPIAAELAPVTVEAVQPRGFADVRGTGRTITGSMLHNLPSLNRDLYDFVRLVPQVSTKIGLPNAAFSAAGVGFRFNNFLISGVSERTVSGGVSTAFAGARSVPLEAIQEYQVLLAPYDARYGDFAGAIVNTVTRSGSNSFRGAVFAHARNDRLARGSGSVTTGRYDREQYGFVMSGPVLRNRVHFVLAPELQRFVYPAPGPYIGQPAGSVRDVPVSGVDLARFDDVMRGYELLGGSAGPVENGNPLRNLFSRVDVVLPAWNSRLILWSNYSGSDERVFSRAAADTFSLSTYQVTRIAIARTTAVQLHTTFRRLAGAHNELVVARRADAFRGVSPVRQPTIRVSVPNISGGSVTLNSGTHETARGSRNRFLVASVRDVLTLPLSERHRVSAGIEAEEFALRASPAVQLGTWTFSSIDGLASGTADRYELSLGGGDMPLEGGYYSAHVTHQWDIGRNLAVTSGLRADLLSIRGAPPYHPVVDSVFGRRTDQVPGRHAELAPRVGLTWDLAGDARHILRGGAGVFAGRFPLAWAHSAFRSYGISSGVLRCGPTVNDLGPPPPFNPRSSPTACANGLGSTASQRGDVNLLAPDLRMARALRGSLAYQRHLSHEIRLATEVVGTRMLSDFAFANLNLREAVGTDRDGRVMYGSLSSSGAALPALRSDFSEVIEVRNTFGNRSLQVSATIEREFQTRSGWMASYTRTRSRDAQTPVRVNTRGTVAWASARVLSGRDDDLTLSTSSNDIPHRVVVAATHTVGAAGAPTRLSLYYVGESGRPFTYTAFGVLRRGDLNADGSSGNDPIYVPRDAFDEGEIRFTGLSDSADADSSPAAQQQRISVQQRAFESFIQSRRCLRGQRGRIMERNSCREPWSNVTVGSVRQTIPVGGRAFDVQLDIYNILNLIDHDWGQRQEAAPALLQHVGQTLDSGQRPQSVFRFDPDVIRWRTVEPESAFQLQLGVRYAF